MGPLGGEGGGRDKGNERERGGMWVDQGGGGLVVLMVFLQNKLFFETFCGEHNLYKHVQKMNTCPVLICKD